MQVIQKIKFLLHRSLISGSSDPGPGNRLRCSRNNYIKNQRNIRIIGSVSLVLLLTISAFTLRPISAETSSAEATANPSTTTLTVETSDSTATLDITPTSPTGTFASSDTSGTSLAFNVSTNNITGYNLSISHESATTPAPLTSEDLSEDLDSLPTGTSISDSEFSNSTYVGYYGYKPSKLNSTPNSNYISAPTTTSTTINVTECANNTTNCNAASDEYTIALGANIDYTKPAGTYTNTFILTAVANNVPYTINYLDNTGTGGTTGTDVSNLPDPESSSTATATNFTLSSTIPTRTGYTFAGWCYGTVTHNATGNDTCTTSSASGSSAAGDGVTYQPGSTFSFANYSSSTNVANLYAMWNVKTYSLAITFAGEGVDSVKVCKVAGDCTGANLMGTASASDNSVEGLVYNTAYYLYPNFTSTSYELDNWTNTGSYGTLSSTSDTNPTFTMGAGDSAVAVTGKTSKIYMQDMVASQCTTTAQTVYDKRDDQAYLVQQLADGKCWLLDNLRLGYAGFASGVSTLDSTNTNTTNSISTSTFTGWNTTSEFSSYDTPMINTASVNTINSDSSENWGNGSHKYGVYYNYCAATMNSYCYTSGSGTGNASEDVCPKGWRMPTGGSSGEYQALYTAYSSNATNFRNALSTPLSGYFYNGSGGQGINGNFWSSTYYSSSSMYYLSVSSSYVYPQHENGRSLGYSVRCVLKQPIESVTYMQDVTAEMVANTAEGATATLIDKRDNQSYLVGKLADGKLWMLDNLRLGASTLVETLSTSNTNMSSSVPFTLPASSSSGFSKYNTAMINTTYANTTTTSYGSGSGKIGVYYNYCAASAGTYCMASGSGSGNASYDVCPKGWRMPTGGSLGEYQNLCNKVKGSTCSNGDTSTAALQLRNVLSTPLSGYFDSSSTYGRGSRGYFLSSTYYYNGDSMYGLGVSSSYVSPQESYNRSIGYSVRCVLK